MKKLKLIGLLICAAQLVHAQKLTDIAGFGQRHNRIEATVFLTLPERPDTIFSSIDRSFLRNGSAFFNTTDSSIYVFYNNRWAARGGSGGGGGADGNNFPSAISFSVGTLTLQRTGLANLTTTINTTHVTEGTNLYHTTARARSSINQGYGIAYNPATGVVSTDTATLFNDFNVLSWDNKSAFDSTFNWRAAFKEARAKSLVKDMTKNGTAQGAGYSGDGMVSYRDVTDSTISQKLVPKMWAVKSIAELRTITGLTAVDTQFVFRVTDYTSKRIWDYQYDPNNSTATDDGKDTIVAGTKRFFRRYEVWNVLDYGLKNDGTTDNAPAFRNLIAKLNGSKNLANRKFIFPGGTGYRFNDTIAFPNSAGWFAMEGEGMFTTRLIYEGAASGKDFFTFLNPQHITIQDLEFVGQQTTNGKPSAMIRLHTNSSIIGNQGMVADNIFRRVLMRGNIGLYDYGIRITCSPDHDQNNEQNIFEQCYIELADQKALSIEMQNSLWNRAYGGRFSGKKIAINLGKPNPGSAIDSTGGGITMFGVTLMSLSAVDTLVKDHGAQFIGYDIRSEGGGQCIVYSRKSADGNNAIVNFEGGSITVGVTNTALGQYHFNVAGTHFSLKNCRASGIIDGLFTDSLTSTYFEGPLALDTVRYSTHMWMSNGASVAVPIQLYTDKGSYHVKNNPNSFLLYTGTGSQSINAPGYTTIDLNPASALTVTNITGGQLPSDKITLVTYNGNTTLQAGASIITPTGSDFLLPANSVIILHRQHLAFGGAWVVAGFNYASKFATLSNNRFTVWNSSTQTLVNGPVELVGGEPTFLTNCNFPQVIINADGLIISGTGGADKGLRVQSTNATLSASATYQNQSGDKFYIDNYGASHAKARQFRFAFDGPNAWHYDHLDAAGEHDFDIASTTKFKITSSANTAFQLFKYNADYSPSADRDIPDIGKVKKMIESGGTEVTFTTSDATPTTVATITPVTGESVTIVAQLNAIKADGSTSVTGTKSRSFLFNASSSLSSASEITDRTVQYLGGGLTTATFTITTSGSNIIIQFTGEAATTINGKVTYTVTREPAPL